MKLYTEEQLQEAYNRGHMDGELNNTDYSITDGFKPIELPSDVEIENYYGKVHDFGDWEGFKRGTKWMRDKIKQ